MPPRQKAFFEKPEIPAYFGILLLLMQSLTSYQWIEPLLLVMFIWLAYEGILLMMGGERLNRMAKALILLIVAGILVPLSWPTLKYSLGISKIQVTDCQEGPLYRICLTNNSTKETISEIEAKIIDIQPRPTNWPTNQARLHFMEDGDIQPYDRFPHKQINPKAIKLVDVVEIHADRPNEIRIYEVDGVAGIPQFVPIVDYCITIEINGENTSPVKYFVQVSAAKSGQVSIRGVNRCGGPQMPSASTAK